MCSTREETHLGSTADDSRPIVAGVVRSAFSPRLTAGRELQRVVTPAERGGDDIADG